MARLAVVEDDAGVRALFARVLGNAGHEPALFESGDAFLSSGEAESFDVVLSDVQMTGASGLEVLKVCRAAPDPPEVILVTGFASVRDAVEAMRLGAFDYLAKPADREELLHRVAQALEARRLRREVAALSGEVKRRHGSALLIGGSRVLLGFLARVMRVAETSSTVLIVGETGTGKEVIARIIQSSGPRADRPYLTVNCAALPENLLESELFGHGRGAFSGAMEMKRGLFEEASGGTLLLDEVGSLTRPAQAKLLRVLEEGSVRRVGENKSVPVDVRILAATNRDLLTAIEAGEFRDDLYYRLSVVTLAVPPLRERPEDVEPLARQFLEESARRLGRARSFSPDTLESLSAYSFPGNVRELRYAIEQAVILSEGPTLTPEDFPFLRLRARGAVPPASQPHAPRKIGLERLREALSQCGGNRVRAARALGISRATLYRLLDRDRPPRGESG